MSRDWRNLGLVMNLDIEIEHFVSLNQVKQKVESYRLIFLRYIWELVLVTNELIILFIRRVNDTPPRSWPCGQWLTKSKHKNKERRQAQEWWSMLLLLRFFHNRKVATRVISTMRESDGSFDAIFLFKVKRKFFISNKELKRKKVLFQKFLGLCWCL